MQVRGNYAYVFACEQSSLSIFAVLDLTQPTAPKLAGTLRLSNLVTGMDVAGNHAYLAAGPSGLVIVDLTDPAHPVRRTTVASASYLESVSVSGNYAYATGVVYVGGQPQSVRLDVIDISLPSQPRVVGALEASEARYHPVAHADGRFLHWAYFGLGAEGNHGGYRILDLSDPMNPLALSQCELPLGEVPMAVGVAGNVAYVVTDDALRTFDIDDPSNPQEKNVMLPQADFWEATIEVTGQHAYLQSGGGGDLTVLDIKEPTNPLPVARFDSDYQSDLPPCVQGNFAYIIGLKKRFRVLDTGNPRQPTLVGAKDDLGAAVTDASIEIRGFRVPAQRGYVAGRVKRSPDIHSGFLQVIDLSDPARPRDLGFLETYASNDRIEVVGTRVYAVGEHLEWPAPPEHRLTVIDVTDPAAMSELG
jgi:hypothetical protein